MATYKHSLWSAPALLIIAVAVTAGAGAPLSAHAAKISQANQQKIIVIRKEEERRLKKQNKSYTQQAKAQAKQYKQAAKLVARQGGDPKPLLDAVAYFEAQSK